MHETFKDTTRALNAGRAIVDGRDIASRQSEIFVTLEQSIATVLLLLVPDPREAVSMLNETLVQGIEQRIALYASKGASNV